MPLALGAYLLFVSVLQNRGWSLLGVPEPSSFLDMRSLTTAWECHRRGIDVIAANPCDPLGRPANYPRLWLVPAVLGLGESATVPLGIVTAAVFVAAVLFLLRPRRRFEAVICVLAVCSPAVMLGVNRGNVDLLLFGLVVLAAVLVPVAAAGAAFLVLAAATLKLYPIFAAGSLALTNRRRFVVLGVVLVLFGVYAALTWRDIRTIQRVVPQQVRYSYGNDVLATDLARGLPGGHNLYAPVLLVLTTGLLLALVHMRQRSTPPLQLTPTDPVFEAAFVAGVAVYAGTFLVAHNYDYRLVFLLLTIPQLAAWSRSEDRPATLALVLLLPGLWLIQGSGLAVGLIAQQLLLATLGAAAVRGFSRRRPRLLSRNAA